MTVETTTNYASGGQYVLGKLSIFTKAGEQDSDEELEWDLRPSFIECSLFESITDQTMSGYVSVLDSLNVYDVLPLYGGERVELEFYTAGAEDKPIEYIGQVYKVSDKVQVSAQTSGYIIKFCSEASILSERVFTQTGYQESADRVVEDIYNRFLLGVTNKELVTLPAQQIQNFTFGAIHPLDAIQIAIGVSKAQDDTAGYIFYENNKEYRLDTLERLYQQEPVAKYSSIHRGMYNDVKERAAESFERVQDIRYDEENSFLDRIQDGIHGSNHTFFDLVTKQVITHHYRKDDFFDEDKSLGTTPNKKPVDKGSDVSIITYVSDSIDWTLDTVRNRMARIESETFRANIIVFGDSTIKAGDVLEVYFPRLNNSPEETSNSIEGNVLVSAIRHTLTKDRYMQEIEIIRDSYNEEAIQ